MQVNAMKRNSANRSALLIASALLSVLSSPPWLGAGEPDAGSDTKGRETPQALVATYNDAVARKDWKTCYLCYDAKMRAEFLLSMFHGIGMKQDATFKTSVGEIAKKHMGDKGPRTNEIAIPQVRPDTRMAKDLRAFEKLQEQFRDLPGFVDEMANLVGEGPFAKLRDVRDIKIAGDLAVGQGRIDYPPPADMVQPIHFCKLDGRWYLTVPDPPPALSVNERAAKLKAEVESFSVMLACSGRPAPEEEPGKSRGARDIGVKLLITVHPYPHSMHLSPAQAKKLIEYFATEGFLRQAVEIGKQEIPDREPSDKYYSLQVQTQNLGLHEDLGWGPKLVKRLTGLRDALDGEAAERMDAILAGLADEPEK
jgi:hypothetical protein